MSFVVAQYRASHVSTASPLQLVVQLYDASIRFMTAALAAMEGGDTGTRIDGLRRSHAIISELQTSLVYDYAPELCSDLDRLYDFVLFGIQQANVLGNRAYLEGAVRVMRELRNAWSELARR